VVVGGLLGVFGMGGNGWWVISSLKLISEITSQKTLGKHFLNFFFKF